MGDRIAELLGIVAALLTSRSKEAKPQCHGVKPQSG